MCLAGDAGSGKSYISYTLGLAIAAGVPALGGLVPRQEPKRVVYFDEENSTQDYQKYLRRSFYGLIAHNGGEEPDEASLLANFWPVHFALGGVDWVECAAQWVRYVQPHLIVVDTATPACNIEDENDNAEATRAMKAIRQLMALSEPTATALILRHAKMRTEKGGARTMRGAKAWKSGTDASLFQIRAAGRPRRDGLALTRLEPDKVRAYGLAQTIYITPRWTDIKRTGLALEGSYKAGSAHAAAERDEDEGLAD